MVPPLTSPHLLIGKTGEEIAEEYLRRKKFVILGKNIRTFRGEIDLIARKGGSIVFVEVKARTRDDGWQPSERVDGEKLKKLKRAASNWLEGQEMEGVPARIDVVGVCNEEVVEHFEDVTA